MKYIVKTIKISIHKLAVINKYKYTKSIVENKTALLPLKKR